ncbi:MAG: caspase family protein [Gemmatimonadaceae bacterium]
MLTQEQATRDAILRAFTALTEATAQDDVVVIFYAGHGSQMTDLEGDEPTGYDSTMMPCDSAGWSGQNRDITDDEISVYLDALGARTSYITLIFDCCHSGTITRDVPAAKVRAVPRDERPRDVLASMRGALPRSALPATAAQPSGPSGWIPLGEKYVMIAGCRDLETS